MQGSKLYVGNLSYNATNDGLKELFAEHGTVVDVNIIAGKGFGFVQMSTSDEAEKVQTALNGMEYQQRQLRIDAARPREERPARNTDGSYLTGSYRRS